MAEAAGLVLGVVALASVFNDCLEIISQISAIRSMGHDAEILNTKLDVEKTLLLQWAERTQILQPGCAPELRNPSTAQSVEKILDTMHGILKDSSEIQTRYGLRERQSIDAEASGATTISNRRMVQFITAFHQLDIQKKRQKGVASSLSTSMASIRWIAVDKEKLERLIKDLSYFVRKLHELVPPADNSLSIMAADDLEGFENTETLRRILNLDFQQVLGLESHLIAAAKVNFEGLCRRRILKTLWFRKVDERREFITPAHSQTLSWAISPPVSNEVETDISQWFRFGSGIYWVSGKAGSGKSTLMKHLFDHPSIKVLLDQWAGDSPLISGCFFFWYLGTSIQKSYDGLTRTLLYHICQTNPLLIPELLPEMWIEALESGFNRPLDLPTLTETKLAFGRLSQMPIKFCFFVDGLDEFSGIYQKGISFIRSMGQASNIKIIVSSRPEPEFVAAFSAEPTLRMENLTKKDIEKYVQDTITSNGYINTLLERKESRNRAKQMLADLVEKADGIFLWIVLACRSVLLGSAMKDRLPELELRVAELPKEIGDMFAYMLSKVDGKYQPQCAKYLRICYTVFTISEERHIPTVGLSILDEFHDDLMGCSRMEAPSADDMKHYCTTLAGRLNSRCGGLLELQYKKTTYAPFQFWCTADELLEYDPIIDTEIVFMHRSVVEFLNNESSWSMNCLQIPKGFFYEKIALSCLWMYMAQCNRHNTLVDTCIARSLCYLYDSADNSFELLIRLLESFQDIIQSIRSDMIAAFTDGYSCCQNSIALIVAVELGIVDYVKHFQKLHPESMSTDICRFPLLYHALTQPFLNSLQGTIPVCRILRSAEMVHHLLSSGCSPNKEFLSITSLETTPWKIWMAEMESNKDNLLSAATKIQITEAILDYGVDAIALSLMRSRYAVLLPLLESQMVTFTPSVHMTEQDDVEVRNKGRKVIHKIFGRQDSLYEPRHREDKRRKLSYD